jgi:hypothetical protein
MWSRELGGSHRREARLVFKDFEQVVTRAGVERLEPEIVEDQEIGATEGCDEMRIVAVAARGISLRASSQR